MSDGQAIFYLMHKYAGVDVRCDLSGLLGESRFVEYNSRVMQGPRWRTYRYAGFVHV